MTNETIEEGKIIIQGGFFELPEEQKKPRSDQMFQYLWGWKNKRHDKPVLVNGELYWIIQSPPPNKTSFCFCNEEQVAVWNDIAFNQQPFSRPIGVAEFSLFRSYRKKDDVQRIAIRICNEWTEHRIAEAKKRVENWKVRRKELFIKHYGADMPYSDPYTKEVA